MRELKKVVVTINLANRGSTGSIVDSIAAEAEKAGYVTYRAYPGRKSNKKKKEGDIIITPLFARFLNSKISKFIGLLDLECIISTMIFVRRMKTIKPDIIHLHNLHGSYICIPILFKYLKKTNAKKIWTLHDCWAFTGRCPHFQISKCDKWMSGCKECPYPPKNYPSSYIDTSKLLWKMKKKAFTEIFNLTIVTPSKWLEELISKSFLSDYPVKTIYNGINLEVFKPTSSSFRQEHNLEVKHVILGVAFGWGKRKGLDVFIELSKRLPKKYQIVLVGTDDGLDKQLPDNIISIHRTQNQQELAEIYSAADVFVNPTREEVLGMVNIEANACGTPVITFRSGGSPECINETSGVVVDCDDVYAMEREIVRICETEPYSKENCLKRAEMFDMSTRFKEYIELYIEQINRMKH